MKRGDGFRTHHTVRRREHLLRQIRGGGMRNGVVRVDDVELLLIRDMRDRGGKREQVLRLAKQRIRRHGHAVEVQSRHTTLPAKRRLAADEMYVMAAIGQGLGQLRRDDAAAAHRRVADHPDSHG